MPRAGVRSTDSRADGYLAQRVSAAAPRLARIARLRGVPPDVAEDIAQQTLLEAWSALDRLRDPARCEAWLDGICRHLCQRYQRACNVREEPLAALAEENGSTAEPADQDAADLDELLDRADRAQLLSRALGQLPAAMRDAVTACYLVELPTGEAALHLGITIAALEVRLHRARQHLRQILSGPLREEAASLGIALPGEVSEGWRETREWCVFCGTRRLRGVLEPLPDGTTRLRLRCPVCSPQYDCDIENSGGLRELNGIRSFRPAVKRFRVACAAYYERLRSSDWRRCPGCSGPVLLRAAGPGDLAGIGPRHYAIVQCATCGNGRGWWATAALWSERELPARADRWLTLDARLRLEPDTLTDYAGQPAVRSRVTNLASGRAIVLFTDPDTPRILGLHEE